MQGDQLREPKTFVDAKGGKNGRTYDSQVGKNGKCEEPEVWRVRVSVDMDYGHGAEPNVAAPTSTPISTARKSNENRGIRGGKPAPPSSEPPVIKKVRKRGYIECQLT